MPIFYYFDVKSYIGIKTNAFDYSMSEIQSQPTFNHSVQWYFVACFLKKIDFSKNTV